MRLIYLTPRLDNILRGLQENFSISRIKFFQAIIKNDEQIVMSSINVEELKSWIVSITSAVLVAVLIRYFIVELYVVDGPSMQPTLQDGERLVVNKFIYHWRDPMRSEVVIFRYPRDHSRDFIKRVIAVGGDTIEIKDGHVFVNDALVNEDYIAEKTRTEYPKQTVPEGTLFVCGANRRNSLDSRFPDVGFVPLELVKGKAALIFWPIDDLAALP